MVSLGARLIGWMLVTLGVLGIVLPLLPSSKGDASNTSPTIIVVCLGLLALGTLLIWRNRREE